MRSTSTAWNARRTYGTFPSIQSKNINYLKQMQYTFFSFGTFPSIKRKNFIYLTGAVYFFFWNIPVFKHQVKIAITFWKSAKTLERPLKHSRLYHVKIVMPKKRRSSSRKISRPFPSIPNKIKRCSTFLQILSIPVYSTLVWNICMLFLDFYTIYKTEKFNYCKYW